MAEGGRKESDEHNKDKSFSSKHRGNFEDNGEEGEMEGTKGGFFCEPDLGVPLKRDRISVVAAAEEAVTGNYKRPNETPKDKLPQSRDVDNPFSFRHFLNKDQTGTTDTPLRRAKGLTGVGGSTAGLDSGNSAVRHVVVCIQSSATQDDDLSGKPPRVALEFASGLPDFVQDHLIQDNYSAFHVENGDGAGAGHVADAPSRCHNSGMYHQEVLTTLLPDFAPSKSASAAAADGFVSPAVTKLSSVASREELAVGPSCKPKTSTRKILGVAQKSDPGAGSGNSSGSLPDFLSDGPMLSNHADLASATPRKTRSQRHRISRSLANDDDVDDGECEIMSPADVVSLIEDRNDLRRKLDETCERLSVESNTVLELRKEVEGLQRKEVDEAVALEQIVEQVEANMQSTTQRAVNSESVISKLKQDIRTLQSEVSRLRTENVLLRSGDENVIKRAKKASEQITEAANTAEHQLRQLLSGLDSLRLISAVLSGVDRVTEDNAGVSASGNIP